MAAGGVTTSQCCGYGTNGAGTGGFDCVMIPSASKQMTSNVILAANAICGRSMGLVSAGGGASATVCCAYFKMKECASPSYQQVGSLWLSFQLGGLLFH